jgi:probable addiction module antidote protein
MKSMSDKGRRARQPVRRRRSAVVPYRNHEDATIESLRSDPQFAAEYLNAVLDDGDQEELLLALRYLANAYGGVPKLAASAKLNATTLYRTLSPRGNPELRSMRALLGAMGMRLAVEPVRPQKRPRTVSRDVRTP